LVTWDDTAISGMTNNTRLLDMTPATVGGPPDPFLNQPTTGFEDAPLAAGQSWTDAQTGLTLTTTAVGAGGADVTVAYGPGVVDVSAPTAPGSLTASVSGANVSLSWTASTDNRGVDHYVVTRDSTDLPAVGGTSAADTPGTGTFSYTVKAVDAAGNA